MLIFTYRWKFFSKLIKYLLLTHDIKGLKRRFNFGSQKKSPLEILGYTAASVLGGVYLGKKSIQYMTGIITNHIISKKYDDNIMELVGSINRLTPIATIEAELRAETNTYILRPIGGPRRFNYLDKIMFNAAQLNTMPTPGNVSIDTSVIIGPRANKPLVIKIPILVGGMAYGLALSEAFKIAWAKGATMAGTATNTGQGPWLESERRAARHLILQYSKNSWAKDEEIIKKSDAVEIQFGQGASAGIGSIMKSKDINPALRKRLGLKAGQDAITHNRHKNVNSPRELASLVAYLKKVSRGVPVGVKIAAGKYIEKRSGNSCRCRG